jgi:hypothetical protein
MRILTRIGERAKYRHLLGLLKGVRAASSKAKSYHPTTRAGAAANDPPLLYLLMRPWVLLPFRLSAVVWLLAGQVCLLLTVWLCFRRVASVAPIPLGATLFVILNYPPLIENLALGQANVRLLFLVTLAWWGLRAGHPWVAAVAVATAVHI